MDMSLLYKLNCGGGSEIQLSVPAKEPSDGLYGFPVPERDRGFESRSSGSVWRTFGIPRRTPRECLGAQPRSADAYPAAGPAH
jgi:hypothetical protein